MINKPMEGKPQPKLHEPHEGIQPNKIFRNRLQGYPVQPGQTWHDVPQQERKVYMAGILTRWTRAMGQQANSVSGLSGSSVEIYRG